MEREHLYLLAGLNPPQAEPVRRRASPELQRLIDGWMTKPAYLIDRHWNLISLNSAVSAVFGYGTRRPQLPGHLLHQRPLPVRNPRPAGRGSRTGRPVPGGRRAVSRRSRVRPAGHRRARGEPGVRRDLGRAPDRRRPQGTKVLDHPQVGELVFEYTMLPLSGHPRAMVQALLRASRAWDHT
ncbi:MmyB family transcriptional regulator [Saccharopolyspora sp. NPDC002376]